MLLLVQMLVLSLCARNTQTRLEAYSIAAQRQPLVLYVLNQKSADSRFWPEHMRRLGTNSRKLRPTPSHPDGVERILGLAVRVSSIHLSWRGTSCCRRSMVLHAQGQLPEDANEAVTTWQHVTHKRLTSMHMHNATPTAACSRGLRR